MFGPSKSLRTKILWLALIPTMLMLIAATAITYVAYQRTTQQIMREQYSQLAIESAARLSESLHSFGQILNELAQEEDIRSLSLERQRLALERWGNRLYPFDAGVAIVNERGIITWSQPLRFDWIGRNMSGAAPFREVMQGESLAFSDLTTASTVMGSDVTLIGVPFADEDGNLAGMLAGVFHMNYPRLSPIYAEVLRVGIAQRSYAYLVDRTGRIIYHPDASRIGEDASSLPAVQRALRGEAGASLVIRSGRDDLVMGYAMIPATGWGLVVQENWQQAMMPVRKFSTSLLAALLISLLVPLVLVYISADRMIRPITALAQGAERIAKGDFEHAVSVHTGDELQKLALQFNMMARRLRASYATLELKVEERTKELSTLNAVAARVGQTLDLDGILDGVLEELGQIITLKGGGLYLLDRETGEPYLVAHRGLSPDLASALARPSREDGLPICALDTGAAFAVSDVTSDERLATSPLRLLGAASLACVPLSAQGEVKGALFLIAQAYREFTLEEMRLLVGIGHQVGIGVENARLFAEEQRRRQEALALAEIADLVSGNLDIDQILRLAVERVAHILGTDQCMVFLCNETRSEPRPAVGCDTNLSDPHAMTMRLEALPFALNEVYPFETVMRTLQPVAVDDVKREEALPSALGEIMGCASMLLTPIFVRDRLLGILYLGATGPHPRVFTAGEQGLAMALCNEIAVALENAQLFTDLERRNAELSTLNAIAAIVNQSLVLEQTFAVALDKTLELMDAIAGEIRLLDPRSNRLALRAHLGLPQAWADHWGSLSLDGELGDVVRSRHARVLDGQAKKPPGWDQVHDLGSLAMVPLHARGRVMGTVCIGRRMDIPVFTPDETSLLMSIGNQLGIAAENARLFERERTRANQLRIINQIGQHITSILSLNELLPFVARTLQEALGYFNVNIFMLDIESDDGHGHADLILRACAGGYSSHLALGTRQGIEEGIGGQVARHAKAALVRDFSREPLYRLLEGDSACSDPCEPRAGIILPVMAGDRVLGILEVQSRDSLPFGEMEVSHLQILADQIAVAIENARLYEESRDLAIVGERTRLARELHDSVTQSLFGIVLNAEAARALISRQPDRAMHQVQRLQEIAQDALAEMRSLIYELRPPSLGEEDLESALQRYVDVIQKRHGLQIALTTSGGRRLPREYEQGLYRIAQEAIMNVVKHAQANCVDVELKLADSSVLLTVQDDGVGFSGQAQPQGEKHFGLTSMRDRAELLGGMFEITALPGEGTRVQVEIPLRD